MMKTLAATEANRHFSALLREVARGEQVTILGRGKPVAKMVPVEGETAAQRDARSLLLTRLSGQAPTGRRDWTRDELYD